MSTETLDKPAVETADKAKPEEKESVEDIERRSRKPPADGPCKGCGNDRPLNRLMLCYSCWVKKNLLDWSRANGDRWIPGDAHPDWCECVTPEHAGATERV